MTGEGRWSLALVGGLCGLFLAAQVPFLDDPYHWDALYYVTASARDIYLHPGQLVTLGPWDNGHPPLFFWILAAAWWIAGPHVAVSHLIVAGSAAAALVLLFLLGRRIFGPREGFLGALFLAVNPIFFYHSGTITGDLPLTALTLGALLAALRGRWLLATLAGCAMALTRESAVLFLPVIAGAAWLIGSPRKGAQEAIEGAPARGASLRGMILFVAAPALALAAWFAAHQAAAGWWIYTDSSREVKLGAADVLRTLPYEIYLRSVRPFLKGHGQWAATLSITAALSAAALRRSRGSKGIAARIGTLAAGVRRGAEERNAWLIAGTAAGLLLPIALTTALMAIFLPRYLLPALPLVSLLAGWAVARTGRLFPLAAAVVIAPLLLAHDGEFVTGWESNRAHLDFVEVTRLSAEWLEESHPDARVLAPWPLWQAICDPIYGYVREPRKVLVVATNAAFRGYCPPQSSEFVHRKQGHTLSSGDFDLVWVFTPDDLRHERLAAVSERMALRFVARFDSGPFHLLFFAPIRDDP